MRGLIWVLALFALAVGVSLAMTYNEGYVLLVLPPHRAEISLSLAVFLILAWFVVFYGLLRAVVLTLSLPRRVREYREGRAREKLVEIFHDAARLLFEGRYSHALAKAAEAHEAGQVPGLAAVLAARAAQSLREPQKQKEWLDRAVREDPKMKAACLMLEAEMDVELHHFSEALDVLDRLHDGAGRHFAALRLELRAHQGCSNWDEVLRIARLLEKHELLPPSLAAEIIENAHRKKIGLCRGDSDRLREYLRWLPVNEQTPALACGAAEALLKNSASEAAQDLIETELDKGWNEELVRLYGCIEGGDVAARIARAEIWLNVHADEPDLLLALGRQCKNACLWGKARGYLETSLELLDRREVRLELGCLLECMGRPDEAMPHYRSAAMLSDS